jgi:predicted transcriptional regulator of viral defense system
MPRRLTCLRDVAEGQWGLVTLQQARAAGVAWRSLTRLAEAGLLDRVAHGVYRVRGAAEPDHLDLRAAWLQLDPARPAWQRLDDPDVAVVSHASAASLYDVGDLRADVHEFSLPDRRQTRRRDVRIHRGRVPPDHRIVVDAVAEITREVLERVNDYPRVVAEAVAPYAQRFGLTRGDGPGLLDELLRRAGTPNRVALIVEAQDR